MDIDFLKWAISGLYSDFSNIDTILLRKNDPSTYVVSGAVIQTHDLSDMNLLSTT